MTCQTSPTRRSACAAGILLPIICAIFVPGCFSSSSGSAPTTQPVTALDPKTAEPGYWYAKPANASVDGDDFDTVWNACRLTARDLQFRLDLHNYREGVLTTLPLVSAGFYEPWRQDVADSKSRMEATLGTIRRTVHFEISREDDAPNPTYRCVPKVLVERFSMIEHRITNQSQYQSIFALTRREAEMMEQRRHDPTYGVPPLYWYGTGRDPILEERIADMIREYLKRPPAELARLVQ